MERGRLMDRQPVRSSNICSVGYEPETHALEVEFRGGGVYQYSGVPETVYQGMMRAASKGSYFHDHVKDRYSFRQVR
jgi:KTSC domain